MALKLEKGTFPVIGSTSARHGPDDFACFGPPAVKDGEFDGVFLADLGCFTQDGKDSNKYYHGSVVQSKKNQKYYAYFEWGRTGKSGDVQFVECDSKEEAQSVFAKQMHEKNDKRGEWTIIGKLKMLRAKAGKDCYLVRPQAKRTVGLPDAQNLIHDEKLAAKQLNAASSGGTAMAVAEPKTKKISKKAGGASKKWDAPTLALLRDMNALAVDYTRQSIEGGAIPTLAAIEEARDLLIAAQKRLVKIGRDLDDQISDGDLRQLSYMIYSRIPKPKRVKAPDSEWILSEQNIDRWGLDLDAFENALNAIELGAESDQKEYDPFQGTDIEMIHIDTSSREGEFLAKWMPQASRNVHSHVGNMRIHNMWAIRQNFHSVKFLSAVAKIAAEKINPKDRPLHQPTRSDITPSEQGNFDRAHVALLFHGSRSVNCPGILKTGFRLPKELVGVTVNGALFGPLIYTADDWRKSAQYCSLDGAGHYSHGSGAVKGRQGFMFVVDSVLGNPHVARGMHGYTEAPKGHHSIFGKAGVSGVHNNEWIIPTPSQTNIRYLVEFSCK